DGAFVVTDFHTVDQRDDAIGLVTDQPGQRPIVVDRRLLEQLTHRAAARSVTGLASMLAHEIKNPLSGIRGAAQLLEQ
ncbi:histidine kinase dimerization/phospho-acceptor domain-containing protein, partial [Rhizobium ruizarguesonis]